MTAEAEEHRNEAEDAVARRVAERAALGGEAMGGPKATRSSASAPRKVGSGIKEGARRESEGTAIAGMARYTASAAPSH